MSDLRLEKLTHLVHRRAGEVIAFELKDPRIGFVTVSRVKLSKDLRHAVIYYSVVGSDAERTKTAHALDQAKGYVQGRIATAMNTRVTPQIRFEFDEAVEGAVRVSQLLNELREQRGEEEPFDPPKEEE